MHMLGIMGYGGINFFHAPCKQKMGGLLSYPAKQIVPEAPKDIVEAKETKAETEPQHSAESPLEPMVEANETKAEPVSQQVAESPLEPTVKIKAELEPQHNTENSLEPMVEDKETKAEPEPQQAPKKSKKHKKAKKHA